jgi:hypothetical protein
MCAQINDVAIPLAFAMELAWKVPNFAKFPKSAKQEFGSCWDRHTIRAETPPEM